MQYKHKRRGSKSVNGHCEAIYELLKLQHRRQRHLKIILRDNETAVTTKRLSARLTW